jgi:hypothetical protein
MSTNITSTSDRVATDSPTSPSSSSSALPSVQENARKYDGVSGAMGAVPDPAVIARLANEFFAALPGAGMPADAAVPDAMPFASTPFEPTPAFDLRAVPGTLPGAVPPAAAPDHPREMFSIPALPSAQSIPGGPQLPSSPPSGPLNEADFRAIAASLAGALPLVPQVSAAATPSAIPSSPSAGAEKVGPWAAEPQIPPAAEMYSFPGVPAMPTSPQTSAPGGADLAAVASAPAAGNSADGRTDPWAAPVNFPGASEVFSFPPRTRRFCSRHSRKAPIAAKHTCFPARPGRDSCGAYGDTCDERSGIRAGIRGRISAEINDRYINDQYTPVCFVNGDSGRRCRFRRRGKICLPGRGYKISVGERVIFFPWSARSAVASRCSGCAFVGSNQASR